MREKSSIAKWLVATAMALSALVTLAAKLVIERRYAHGAQGSA